MVTDSKPLVRRGRRLFQVRFPDIIERVYEDQLEPLPEERMNPLDLLEQGKLGTPKDFRRTLMHVRLTGRLADIIYSMEATNTDFHAYQFKPVLKLLQTPTKGLLVADEVGLGKTIEAGLIWTELRSRFNMRKLLVLCPAALREKWQYELTNKMGLLPIICDAKETTKILKDERSHARGFAIISSMQGLRPPRGWEYGESGNPEAAQLAKFLQSMENEEPLIDLLIVDEAHHMRNPKAQTNSLGVLLRRVSEYLVLLTATPIHNKNRDLHSLLYLLDPSTFRSFDDFSAILSANEPLVRARDLVLSGEISIEKLKNILNGATSNPLLRGNRQLKALLSDLSNQELVTLSERSRIAYRIETINLLGYTVTRTRKRDVTEWRVSRVPFSEFIPMTCTERQFYNEISEVVINYAMKRDIVDRFLLVIPQRQMASCMPAALKSWKERRIEVATDEFSDTNQSKRANSDLGPLTQELVDRSDDFVSLEKLIESDSKYYRLRDVLQGILNDNPQEKIILFSTFRGTLAYLAQRLTEDSISTIILQGGGVRRKDDIIQEFQSHQGPSVLLGNYSE